MRHTTTLVFCLITLAAGTSDARAQEPNFGRALALTDSELFVGQPVNWYGPGTVYAYRLDGGEWREAARLTASDSARMDDFGRALAVAGNTLVVGAPRKRSGAAYVFERPSPTGEWRQVALLEPQGVLEDAGFGTALALDGDDLLVGAPGANTVYHYRLAGGSWRVHETLTGGAGAEAFGYALALAGDRLLLGAPASDSVAGRVYASHRESNGDWSTPTAIALSNLGPQSRAGWSISIDDERAYVGAPGAASVLVLEQDGAEWRSSGTLTADDARRGSQFGHAVAAVGNEVWVGAPGVLRSNGRVYRFTADAAALPINADSADGTAWPFGFGYSIAAAGGRAVIGQPTRDFGEGRVLALARSGDAWTPSQLIEGEIFAIGRALETGMRCEEGRMTEFPCANIELVAHVPLAELGGARGAWVNDVWGWSDPETGRDYALVARRDGASFVDVTEPSAPRVIGNLPRTVGSPPSVWRDIKVIGHYAFIVSDGAQAHGMQVFDLTRLRAPADTPAVFTPEVTYDRIHSAHNVVADTASGFVYIVGANGGGETCGGGLHMVDVRDPLHPTFAGCYNDRSGANDRGYTHDAQCLIYEGPDQRYRGRELCIGSNEAEINIADVTDKANPVTVGRSSYPNVAYAHQGWFDAEQRYFYMNDEADELAGTVAGTRTIVWDLTRLDDPVVANMYIGPVPASDHNLYVKGDRVYESNYGSGLRVLDISDRTNPREIAFFDSAPYNDNGPGHSAGQSGAWSNYPFFDGDIVVFTSVREGLFIVKVTPVRPIS